MNKLKSAFLLLGFSFIAGCVSLSRPSGVTQPDLRGKVYEELEKSSSFKAVSSWTVGPVEPLPYVLHAGFYKGSAILLAAKIQENRREIITDAVSVRNAHEDDNFDPDECGYKPSQDWIAAVLHHSGKNSPARQLWKLDSQSGLLTEIDAEDRLCTPFME